jgi:hypothetical protein
VWPRLPFLNPGFYYGHMHGTSVLSWAWAPALAYQTYF